MKEVSLPLWADQEGTAVGLIDNSVVEYSQLLGKSDTGITIEHRQYSLVRAANGVTTNDIVSEIENNWNNNEYVVLTIGATGNYGLDRGYFRKHMTISSIKKSLDAANNKLYTVARYAEQMIETREKYLKGELV